MMLSKPSYGPRKNTGIALIQVLLITAILSVLALYLTQTAREQITIARWLDDKASAQVALHSAESQLLFSLLTEPFLAENIDLDNNNNDSDAFVEPSDASNTVPMTLKSRWNFFGKAFAINEHVKVAIQDQSGLIHAHYPIQRILRTLITSQGFSEIESNVIIDNLLDWQDLDSIARINGNEEQTANSTVRNGAISSLSELVHIKAIPPRLLPILKENLTIYRRGNFNPRNASIELIAALSSKSIAEQVNTLRVNKQLTKRNFIELTGIREDDEIYFYPSNYLAIDIFSQVGKSIATKVMTIKVQPNAGNNISPINIYSNRS
ncbi:MAG: type II secretion system protein GspK [Colwellia sp.]|nr:type II secretion system protein GspK [Colwellia sp.]